MGMRLMVALVATSVLALGGSATAHAGWSYYGGSVLTDSNLSGYADGGNYGIVRLYNGTGTDAGNVRITVTLSNALADAGGKFLGFAFNETSYNASSPTLASSNVTFNNTPSSTDTAWENAFESQGASPPDSNKPKFDGFGVFNYGSDPNNANDRATYIELVLDTTSALTASQFVALSSGNTGEGNVYFSAHILVSTGGLTGYFGATKSPTDQTVPDVPEPMTLAIWSLIGLPAGFAALRRRQAA